ncbi:MAG: endonuclease/exonuclease/phosphatase family protein [Spirochaetia bacterium]|jgi:endonuclease/exonuclease/phosphatase family metal-dependent hydrolase|nr:endonuclease/exonuclease/phosphatase family protein [Spirochaetia bacterium]
MRKKQFSGQIAIIFTLLAFFLVFISCTKCVLPGSDTFSKTLVFMSYNTQNIFDDIDNGTEYPEFDPSNGEWGTSLYNTRLINLSEVIRRSVSGGPDLIALQEIENKKVAEDLIDGYLKGMDYNYLIVTDLDYSAIQLGFISRLELENIKIHQIIQDGKIIGRPILEASITTDTNLIYVFNNHWKSKLGGAEETEPARIASSALLSRRINELQLADPMVEIVVLGDLNENWDEYRQNNGDYTTALIPFEDYVRTTGSILITENKNSFSELANPGIIHMFSPWCTYTESYGSYVYNDSWETIDHILLNSSMFNGKGYDYKSFSVVSDDFLLNTWDQPLSWRTETGLGYSDHLPILLKIEK